MSLKILKQQLQDIAIQDESKEKESRKKQKQRSYQEAKFTRTRKVMKKNLKPKTQVDSIETNVNRIKEEVAYAREREEANKEWNMKIIDAVSTVDGTDVMNLYLKKKGLLPADVDVKKRKSTTADSYRIKSKAKKKAVPESFAWK